MISFDNRFYDPDISKKLILIQPENFQFGKETIFLSQKIIKSIPNLLLAMRVERMFGSGLQLGVTGLGGDFVGKSQFLAEKW